VRSLCVLRGSAGVFSGRLRDISATGAFLETNHRPALGSPAMMSHPLAGEHGCSIVRHALDGVGLSFDLGENSVRFALTVISAEMADGAEAEGLSAVRGGI
jgi:PilZ domain